MTDPDFRLPHAEYVSPDDIQPGAVLNGTNLSNAELFKANLAEASLVSANLSQVNLEGADLNKAFLGSTDLSDAYLSAANFSNAKIRDANLSGSNVSMANLSNVDLRNANLSEAELRDANLSGANLSGANLSEAEIQGADLSGANLSGADLSDTNLSGANLSGTNLEHAVLVRTNLFDTDLTNSTPHGATFTDAQINDGTIFRSEKSRKEDGRHWQKGPFLPPRRCGYDPVVISNDDETDANQLSKAADTYQTFEKLARENAQSSLQSEMFVLRQDMQRKRHWHNVEPLKWLFARVSRTVFKHGESLGRIALCAGLIIFVYTIGYTHCDLITDADGEFVDNWVDALYFSTLTFTTLGLGDFQPSATSEFARLAVTSQAALGAILIAIFVFVLGRRAAK